MKYFEKNLSTAVVRDEDSREKLRDMRQLATGPESSLIVTNGILQNYNLRALSTKDHIAHESVRAARFRNGLFLSFRMLIGDRMLQPDMKFYDDVRFIKPYEPDVTIWDLHARWEKLTRSAVPYGESDRHQLLGVSSQEFVSRAHDILAREALAEKPWEHAYTPAEISSVRYKKRKLTYRERVVDPTEIGMNPELHEPYL